MLIINGHLVSNMFEFTAFNMFLYIPPKRLSNPYGNISCPIQIMAFVNAITQCGMPLYTFRNRQTDNRCQCDL